MFSDGFTEQNINNQNDFFNNYILKKLNHIKDYGLNQKITTIFDLYNNLIEGKVQHDDASLLIIEFENIKIKDI